MSFLNRISNTFGAVPRTWGNAVFSWIDAVNVWATGVTQMGQVVSDTWSKIKDLLSTAWTKGKRYQKLVNMPWSVVLAAGTWLEGIVRAVVEPVVNAGIHTRDVVGNMFINQGKTVQYVWSKKPVGDFKYEHLKTRDISKKNWLSKWLWKPKA